jgi:hypothetical protein
MGKKKSVVLMVLLTIVIVALCAITLFPAFTIPGGVQKWNPVTLQYDLGADLGGGYYAYYYPEGVISETEYQDNLPEGQAGDEAYDEYVSSYMNHGGFYVETDSDLGLVEADGGVLVLSQSFKQSFAKAVEIINARFEQKEYSDYRVSVVDDVAIRVEIPASEYDANNTMVDRVGSTLSSFANLGEVTIKKGDELITEMVNGAKASDLIKNVSVATRYDSAYLKISLTSAGKEMIKEVKESLSPAPTTSGADTSSLTKLGVFVGDLEVASIYSDNVMDNNEIRTLIVENVYQDYVETTEILLTSALALDEAMDMEFTISSVRTFDAVYGVNTLTLVYVALGILLVALLVLPVIFMGRFGVVSVYTSLSYLIVTAMCFAFINKGVFEITLGSVLVFVAGLVLVNVIQKMIYGAIKNEVALGKTVESAVKGGQKKTLFGIVDIYAVLLLAALSALIGIGGMYTFAVQAIICVVTGAFCNLLWARAINFTFLSASQDKYKYFRFVREDDDDE